MLALSDTANFAMQIVTAAIVGVIGIFVKVAMDKLTSHINSRMDELIKTTRELAIHEGVESERKLQADKEVTLDKETLRRTAEKDAAGETEEDKP